MPITYRSVKGSKLTIAEMDANFQYLENAIPITPNVTYAWVQGTLSFIVRGELYPINGVGYTAPETTVTLEAADGTHPRYDALILTSSNTATYIKGTASATPALPDIDDDTEYLVTYVYIPAGATEPGEITSTNIYTENAEWTATENTGAVRIDVDSTNTPDSGTYCVEFSSPANGDYLRLTALSPISRSVVTGLKFRIKLKAALPNATRINVIFFNGSDVAATNTISLKDGVNGLDNTNTTTYQDIIISNEDLGVLDPTIAYLQFRMKGTCLGFFLDNIEYQTGLVVDQQDLSNYLTRGGYAGTAQDLADAVAAVTEGQRRRAVINLTDNTAAPPTEVSGDRYILDFTGASHADWDGAAAGDIVEFNGTTWVASTPIEGWIVYVDALDVDYRFVDDGSPAWEEVTTGGGGSSVPVDKTGTTIVFTEDALYNKTTPLTSGNLTLDLTGAVIGAGVWVYCDSYTPTISGADYLITGYISATKLNQILMWYDGNKVNISVAPKTYLSTPTISINETIADQLTLSNFGVANATGYEILFNIVEATYANTAAMIADQGSQTSGQLQYVTDIETYYEYDGTTVGDITDYTEITGTETGTAAAVTTPAYNGTDTTYTHTGLTIGVDYLHFIKATGNGYLDSLYGMVEGTPAAGFTFNVVASDSTFVLPLNSLGTYNFQIFLDDVAGATITTWNQAEATIALGDTSSHKIELRGTITGWSFNNSAQASKLRDVSNWGTLKLGNGAAGIDDFFEGCTNMTISATDILDMNTTTMKRAFYNCDAITTIPNIHLWSNWANVTSVDNMLAECAIANPDLNNIDFSNVTIFTSMLQNADGFTGTLANIDTSSGTNFNSMFRLSALANPDVTNWNMGNATTAQFMLSSIGVFDRSLANWDVTSFTGTGLSNFLNLETISTANLDATVISWAAQAVNSSVTCHFGGATVTGTVADSGTTTGSTTAFRLIQSGQNFFTTVQIGDAVRNTTDSTYALVTNIVSDTELVLNKDIMATGEAFIIYNNAAAKAIVKLISTYNWTVTFGGFV